MGVVRFRTLGCYPLSGAIESTAATVDEIIHETRSPAVGAPGATDRHRPASVDGEQETGGVFRTAHGTARQRTDGQTETVRLITCGSVDDGKSTLIGRLLVDSGSVFDDQLAAVTTDSRRYGTQGERPHYALLLDGRQAEREQGITIDVAYRYFSTARRNFIVADAPGREQYTRNMVTGASHAHLGIVLVDARKGLLAQPCRHSRILALIGVQQLVLAVNKMDLVHHEREAIEHLVREYAAFAQPLGFGSVRAIPLSALEGDNVRERSQKTPWYDGPSLGEYLDTVDVERAEPNTTFRTHSR